jgi:hypothetical protein
MKKIALLVSFVFFLAACQAITPLSTPTNTLVPTSTFTIEPTITIAPTQQPTRTPIPNKYVTLQDPFPNCKVMISQNDSFNGAFPDSQDIRRSCIGERYGHFDLSPYSCTGPKTIVAPVGGTLYMFDPDGGGVHAMNITLPPKTLLSGIEDAFLFIGVPFDPINIQKIDVDLGHINFNQDIGSNVMQGQEIGTSADVPLSKIVAGIFAENVFITYKMPNGKVQELNISPSLLTHGPWINNASSPYDMIPKPKDYRPGCPLLNE